MYIVEGLEQKKSSLSLEFLICLTNVIIHYISSDVLENSSDVSSAPENGCNKYFFRKLALMIILPRKTEGNKNHRQNSLNMQNTVSVFI